MSRNHLTSTPVRLVLGFAIVLAGQGLAFGGNIPVVTVPWFGDPNVAHAVISGQTLILQGSALPLAGTTLTSATWDPGDGSGPIAVAFGDPRILEASHTYVGGVSTPFTATLTVMDDMGNTGSDTFRVVIVDDTLDAEVNMAIDHGLWALYKRQMLSSSGGVPTGFWNGPQYSGQINTAATTSSATLAFEINNHVPTGDPLQDPYVDTVSRGLAHTFTELSSFPIGVQTAGDPDVNGNGIGLQVLNGSRAVYTGGQVMDAIIASDTPTAVTTTGGVNVIGRPYWEIVQDMIDMFSWGQVDSGSAQGSWRYSWQSQADNSAAQWWAIGTLAAERQVDFAAFVSVPDFVKNENLNGGFLTTSQTFDGSNTGNDGRFGYDSASYTPYVNGMNTTPSGLVQLIADGVQSDAPRFKAAERFMVRQWATVNGPLISNQIYGMFATAKAMRLALPNPIVLMDDGAGLLGPIFDWYASDTQAPSNPDPVDGLARHLVNTQLGTDLWDGGLVAFNDLSTAWALVILSSTIIQNPPVAVCEADPELTGVGVPVEFDGTGSYHTDFPKHEIVSWDWDFDGDGVYDATGPVVTHAFAVEDVYPVELRVTDDNVPPLTDTATCCVTIIPPPIPPNADPGGPYRFCIGCTPFILDGSGSGDVDGTIVSFGWDYDPQGPLDFSFDDASDVTVDVTDFFTNLGPGIYDVGLRVVDDVGLSNDDFTTIQVFASGDCPVPQVTNYCQAGVNNDGQQASISATGSTSVSANDFGLVATDLTDASFAGLFVMGDTPDQVPFVNGFLCVDLSGTFLRLNPIINGGGNTISRAVDNTVPPTNVITPASTWYFQYWYRDLPYGTNFTNGLRVCFIP